MLLKETAKIARKKNDFFQFNMAVLTDPKLLELDDIELPTNSQLAKTVGVMNLLPIGRSSVITTTRHVRETG